MASLSDTPRRLGSESGRIRRAARDIERGGGNPTRFLEEAAKVKLGERGITSADSNAEEQRLGERLERGLLETRRRSLMDGTRPDTNGIGAAPQTRSAATPAPVTPPAPASPLARGTGVPGLDAMTDAVGQSAGLTPRRSGLIDGRPASDVLNPMRDRVATLQSGQPFGSSIATKNLESKGLDGAVADYQRRAALQDDPSAQPGNKTELIADLNIPGVSEIAGLAGRKTTPLQDALEAARARRIAAEPMIPDAAPSVTPKPMTVGGVEVRDPSYGLPRGPSPRSAATPGLVTPPDAASGGYGNRPDGTPKGTGYLGELKLSDGGVATEYSMQSDAVKLNGKRVDFPTLVPTLSPEEVQLMTNDIIPNKKEIPESIIQKAIKHAKDRMQAGESLFAGGEKPQRNRPVATFQPLDGTQSESALLNRRKQAEMAAARKKLGDQATAPEGFEDTRVGGLLKFISRPRL